MSIFDNLARRGEEFSAAVGILYMIPVNFALDIAFGPPDTPEQGLIPTLVDPEANGYKEADDYLDHP